MSLLDEALREIVDVDHPEAPPEAQDTQDRVRAEILTAASGRIVGGYSANLSQAGYVKSVTVNFSDGTGI